jgi:hypothetical protein
MKKLFKLSVIGVTQSEYADVAVVVATNLVDFVSLPDFANDLPLQVDRFSTYN